MTRRNSLMIACGVVFVVQVTLAASADQLGAHSNEIRDFSGVPSFIPKPQALTSADPRKFTQLDKAYLDVFTILNDKNECSRFYGGASAIEPLTELVKQLKPTHLDRFVAIRMSGTTTMFQNYQTGFQFRMFKKAEINLSGPFYRSSAPSERRVKLTSELHSNTRESRILVLLHELGHLVRGADRKWVLPDDGMDRYQSLKNSELVNQVCRAEIDRVIRMSSSEQLENASEGKAVAGSSTTP